MDAVQAPTAPSWYATPLFHRVVLGVLGFIALGEGYVTVFHRENDFNCHLTFGQDFLAGDPYRNGGNYYPLGRVMFDTLPASMAKHAARAAFYAAALLALVGCFGIWLHLTWKDTVPQASSIAIVALTLTIVGAHLLRDLDEAGLQTLALFLLSAGAYALVDGRAGISGCCLAAAAVYKATPLLFLPFLLWKREWRASAWMAGFIVFFSMAPALYLGWDGMLAGNQTWCHRTLFIMRNMPDAYPSIPGAEEPKIYNVGLTAFLARYVETYPPGHSLHMNHPGFLQFGNLPVEQAKLVVKGLTLLLGVWIGWNFRRSWRTPEGRDRLPREWAVACLFSALMSPLCWKQHLVFGLPCAFLVARDLIVTLAVPQEGRDVRRRMIEIGFIVGAIWLTRSSLIGGLNAHLCLSYKLDTIAFLYLGWRASRPPLVEAAQAMTLAPPDLANAA